MRKIGFLTLAVVLALALALPVVTYAEPGVLEPSPGIRPIIFIHGGSGSALQFDSQFLRFASNGYPVSYLFAFEWTTGVFPPPEDAETRTARLDAFVDDVLQSTGAEQVYILGHSAGSGVSRTYFADPERAAKVAGYVSLDAGAGTTAPEGIPTLAVFAELSGDGQPRGPIGIVGATNVIVPGTFHVGVASHAEAFAAIYEFFTGEEPGTVDIVPEPPGQVRLAGRAVFFPANVGVGDATLQIWEVDGATGFRIDEEPAATYTLSGTGYYDGAWGPFKAHGAKHYEFVILREGYRPHHFYFESFMRSNYFIRLNTSPPGGVGELLCQGDNHSNIVVTRDNELRSGCPSGADDILEIDGVNILEALTPITSWIVGIFVYDWHADGISDLTAPIPFLHALTFLTGVDFYMPAADPPDGTISLVLTPRGGDGKTQVINVPNWASSEHAISVRFNDYVQDINSWTEYVPRQAPGQQRR